MSLSALPGLQGGTSKERPMTQTTDFSSYCRPTYFIDSDSPDIQAYASGICDGIGPDIDKAIALYYRVRDDVRYDPYSMEDNPEAVRASTVLNKKAGFCVAKAVLLAAVARAQGIPSRLGFADVRNHLVTDRLKAMMDEPLFVYHGYVELFLEGAWVKATPAFNRALCRLFNVKPLEFDGIHDSIFHEFNNAGNRHMEYVRDHGTFDDLPYDLIYGEFRRCYPKIFQMNVRVDPDAFGREALKENSPGAV